MLGSLSKKQILNQTIVRDVEYPGHELTIKVAIWAIISKKIDVRFKAIGKNSPAHKAAYFGFTKKY